MAARNPDTDAAAIVSMDLLTRYKTLPTAQRLIEMKTMMVSVLERLHEHGGATPEELRLLTEALVVYVEGKKERKPLHRVATAP